MSYALGSENQDLPAFVAIPDPRGVPQVGVEQLGPGLPARRLPGHGVQRRQADPQPGAPAGDHAGGRPGRARLPRSCSTSEHLERYPGDTELAARIASYELAARMQLSVPEVGDLSSEPAAHPRRCTAPTTRTRSRPASPATASSPAGCSRRGVRFVQLFNGAYAMGEGVGNWDGHKTLKSSTTSTARSSTSRPRPCSTDLKQRGLLDDTLVVWVHRVRPDADVPERGERPRPQPERLHRLAGRRGREGAVQLRRDRRVRLQGGRRTSTTIYDLHATILHLLGLDHERLSFYHNGIERRLTDVHGQVVQDVLS